MYVCMYIRISEYLCVCMCVCVCMHACIRMYICMYVRMCICMYVCTYVCQTRITDLDTVTNVQDTDIWFCVLLLLLKSRVGQFQHCTSQYFHFPLGIYICLCCAMKIGSMTKRNPIVSIIRVFETWNSCVRGTDLIKGKNEQKLKAASIPSVTMETPQLLLLVLLGLLIYTNCLKLRKCRHPILRKVKYIARRDRT